VRRDQRLHLGDHVLLPALQLARRAQHALELQVLDQTAPQHLVLFQRRHQFSPVVGRQRLARYEARPEILHPFRGSP